MILAFEAVGAVSLSLPVVAAAAVLVGGATGLRTLTPIAVICWFAHLGRIQMHDTWAFWTANTISVAVFTLLACGEYIGDKLPKTPSRISAVPLLGRTAFGALCGAIVQAAFLAFYGLPSQAVALGAIVGGISAIAGAYLGYNARRSLTKGRGLPDLPIAIVEDLVAIALATGGLLLIH